MGKSGSSVGKHFLAGLVILAIASGSAWAAESSTASVPSGSDYTVTAVLVAGMEGAEVLGGGDNGHEGVEFSVGFGANGGPITINGEAMGMTDPGLTYTVTIDCNEIDGVWYASTTITDCSGTVVGRQIGHEMSGAASEVSAEASEIDELTVE